MNHRQRQLDDALRDTFPASDPVSALQPGPAAIHRPSAAKADMSRIDIGDGQEVRFWARELNVSTADILSAVAAVGVGMDKVRAYVAARFPRPAG